MLFSEEQAGSGLTENSHSANSEAIAIFGDTLLYANLDECTPCTACYQPDVCPVGAIYSEEHLPDGTPTAKYHSADPNKGHDHTFFVQQEPRHVRGPGAMRQTTVRIAWPSIPIADWPETPDMVQLNTGRCRHRSPRRSHHSAPTQ